MKTIMTSCLRVVVTRNGEDLGFVSFNKETDFSNCDLEQTQWITLFDEPDDDVFDGELGEDDEESPRVLISFKFVD